MPDEDPNSCLLRCQAKIPNPAWDARRSHSYKHLLRPCLSWDYITEPQSVVQLSTIRRGGGVLHLSQNISILKKWKVEGDIRTPSQVNRNQYSVEVIYRVRGSSQKDPSSSSTQGWLVLLVLVDPATHNPPTQLIAYLLSELWFWQNRSWTP